MSFKLILHVHIVTWEIYLTNFLIATSISLTFVDNYDKDTHRSQLTTLEIKNIKFYAKL